MGFFETINKGIKGAFDRLEDRLVDSFHENVTPVPDEYLIENAVRLKVGVKRTQGEQYPIVNEPYDYSVAEYMSSSTPQKLKDSVKWVLFRQLPDGNWKELTFENQKKGHQVTITFTGKNLGKTLRLEAFIANPEHKCPPAILIYPQAGAPKLVSVELQNTNGQTITESTPMGYTDPIIVKIATRGLVGRNLSVELWERDTYSNTGHDEQDNQYIIKKDITVTQEGRFTVAQFNLTNAYFKQADKNILEGDQHEYYVVVKVLDQELASQNTANVEAEPIEPQKQAVSVKNTTTKQVASGNKFVQVKKVEVKETEREDDLEEVTEAIIYISDVIASEIETSFDGKVSSYPDYGAYNGMAQYTESNTTYCKELHIQGRRRSIFPTYKTYIYRGKNAVSNLKKDLKENSFSRAEPIILETARHSGRQNKTYNTNGPAPPNSISNLYRIKYMQAWNHSGKESFRYRIVDDSSSNFPTTSNYLYDHKKGSMTLKGRSSISIDPWRSSGLVGCIGIREKKGKNHPSYKNEIGDLSKANYKNVYHSLNNYLESILPELTGVFGRRGYSSSGKTPVAKSMYKKEIKVYALIAPLPEIEAQSRDDRTPPSDLVFSSDGIDFLKGYESETKKDGKHILYNDDSGYCTIGYGHLVAGKKSCDSINNMPQHFKDGLTDSEAEDLFQKDISIYETIVKSKVKVNLYQHEYDALVSFTFNVGGPNLDQSTLLRKVNEKDYEGAAEWFAPWNKSGGVVMNGLIKRRAAESNIFKNGTYDSTH